MELVELRRCKMSDPDSRKTQDDGQSDVGERPSRFAVACEVERLQAEGGECGEAAAKPHHDKGAGVK